jgi:site-specific DNA recombinase
VWTLRTVAEILANPRYTGRQVWNRYRTDHHETAPGDKRTGRPQRHQPNPKSEWVVSTRQAHPALVSEPDFVTAQHTTAIATPRDGSTRTYLLAGLVICGTCSRRADSHWGYHHPAYRCRHGHTSATPPAPDSPKNLYIREDRLIAAVATQLDHVVPQPARNAQNLATYLRTHHMTIVCDQNTITIRGSAPLERSRSDRPPRTHTEALAA